MLELEQPALVLAVVVIAVVAAKLLKIKKNIILMNCALIKTNYVVNAYLLNSPDFDCSMCDSKDLMVLNALEPNVSRSLADDHCPCFRK